MERGVSTFCHNLEVLSSKTKMLFSIFLPFSFSVPFMGQKEKGKRELVLSLTPTPFGRFYAITA